MPRPRPFLFCRYLLSVDGEKLEGASQYGFLSEMQGRPFAHGKKAERERRFDTLIMRPRRHERQDTEFLSWSVGQLIESRVLAVYDEAKDKLEFEVIEDGSVRFTDFISIPSLGAMAVDDRAASDLHLGGKQAINRLTSLVRSQMGAEIEVTRELTAEDVNRALKTWDLQKYSFTIRPNNPRPVSSLARKLSAQMKADGIGQLRAEAKPPEGGSMSKSDEGLIEAASDLVEAGYGQQAISGYTENHIKAEIKKPRFDQDPEKNDKAREKARELRVMIEPEEDSEEEILETTFDTLKQTYGIGRQT